MQGALIIGLLGHCHLLLVNALLEAEIPISVYGIMQQLQQTLHACNWYSENFIESYIISLSICYGVDTANNFLGTAGLPT